MDSTLQNGLSLPFLRQFIAVQIKLNTGQTINLIDGSGVVSFGIDGVTTVFQGRDPVFGTLATMSNVEERIAQEAPRFSFTILPPNDSAQGTLMQPTQQGSSVRVWWGRVDELTGAVAGAPELLWAARIDTARTTADASVFMVELDTVSAFDRLFVAEEGARINGAWHKSIWPGETGLDFVYDTTTAVYWGIETPMTAAQVYAGGGAIDVFKWAVRNK